MKKFRVFQKKFFFRVISIFFFCLISIFVISFLTFFGYVIRFFVDLSNRLFSDTQMEDIAFPDVGVAVSDYQINGADNFPNSNWAIWENTNFSDGTPHTFQGEKSGKWLDWWNHPDELIQSLNILGVKHYRFSIERSLVEPEPGKYDLNILEKYKFFCKKLIEHKIQPFITLHHFVDPFWFSEKNGFEVEENIDGFVDYCVNIVSSLNEYVEYFATINEPAVYTFQGYVRGVYPPGQKNLSNAAVVLKNLLLAHCKIYQRVKNDPATKNCQIGITHNVLRFRAFHWFNPIEQVICFFLTKITHRVVLKFFKKGEFNFNIPFFSKCKIRFLDAPECLDFFGIQYYTDPLLRITYKRPFLHSTHYEDEVMTNCGFRFYPEGLHSALKECQKLKVPLYVTETGIDIDDEEKRVEFYKKVIHIVRKNSSLASPIQKVYFWSLIDNSEWNFVSKNKFGVFSFDPSTREIKLRKVGKYLQSLINDMHK